jgi:hypothetical protein
MSIRITDTQMTSDQTRHTATAWPVPDEPTLWSVTWLPGRALTRNQAITAMTIAEMVVERADILADSSSKLWWHMDAWAEELGITGPNAVAEASLSPEDHADSPDPEPSRPTAAEHDASSTAAADASPIDEGDSADRDRSPR